MNKDNIRVDINVYAINEALQHELKYITLGFWDTLDYERQLMWVKHAICQLELEKYTTVLNQTTNIAVGMNHLMDVTTGNASGSRGK